MPSPPSAPRRSPTTGTLALLLVFIALAWRLAYALAVDHYVGDELKCSLPTVHEILAGRIPIYVYSNAYMAPVHELFSAGLFQLGGESRLALRLPGAVFASLGIGLWFLMLLRGTRPLTAFWICVIIACANSAVVSYTALSMPTYGAGFFLIAVIQWLTLRTAARRTAGHWLLLGLLGGFAAYVFRLSLIQTGASLLFLFANAPAVHTFLARRRADAPLRRRIDFAAGAAALAGLALALVAYHYLTRRATYVASPLETAAGFAGGATLGVVVLYLLAAARPLGAAWVNAAAFGAAFLVAFLPITYRYDHVVRPQLVAAGQPPHDAATYALKHAHEWPFQLRLFFERVVPTLVRGRAKAAVGDNIAEVSLTWRGALSALAGLASVWLFFRQWRRATGARMDDPRLVFLLPVPLVLLALLPSWNLHNDWCFRFLLPFLPGLLLAMTIAFEPLLARHRRLAIALCLAYVAYCGIDCRLFSL